MGTKTAPIRGARGCFRFPGEERLKKRSDIRAVFGRGRSFGCRGAKLFVLKNSLPRSRICFTFSRGFGNAVERNRARRLGREAWRYLRPRIAGGCDVILLVYPETPQTGAAHKAAGKSGFAVRMEQLTFLLSKAGLLR